MKHSILILFLTIGSLAFGQTKKPPLTIAKADSLLFAGDAASARDMYSKLLKDTSRNATAWSRYGLSNLNLKKYDEAIRLYQKAITLRPVGAVKTNTYVGLARAYAATGSKSKALISLDSAARLGYINVSLVDSHDDLKGIRDDLYFKEIRQRIYVNQNPCLTNAQSRQFDFWAGDWDVFVTGTTQLAGHNKIDIISGGCALLENWESTSSTGKSINFVDPLTGKWRQTWVGSYPNGIQDFVSGEYKDGAMRFAFETTDAQNNKLIGRFNFYNESSGQVRQVSETSNDNGTSWVTVYDFTYKKRNK